MTELEDRLKQVSHGPTVEFYLTLLSIVVLVNTGPLTLLAQPLVLTHLCRLRSNSDNGLSTGWEQPL